jgi:shikimate 5-dehydrogenase
MSEQKFGLPGIMGGPVAHSRAPALRNHGRQKHNLPGAHGVMPEITPELRRAVEAML